MSSWARIAGTALAMALVLAGGNIIGARRSSLQLPLEPGREAGQSVTPAYEGWFRNPDGSFNLLVGYYNRNQKQTLDIPVGPNNRVDPGGPDQGQPTHFLTRRQWGVFTIRVPADFGERKLTWTIVANGQTMAVSMGLHRDYEVEPYKDAAEGNTPPVVWLHPQGPPFQGPPFGIATTLSATLSAPTTLTVRASDDGKVDSNRRLTDTPVTVSWSKFRGPGSVSFTNPRPPVDKTDGRATTDATFSAPGEYVLRLQANDVSGDGGSGFQCCWTNVLIGVDLKP